MACVFTGKVITVVTSDDKIYKYPSKLVLFTWRKKYTGGKEGNKQILRNTKLKQVVSGYEVNGHLELRLSTGLNT